MDVRKSLSKLKGKLKIRGSVREEERKRAEIVGGRVDQPNPPPQQEPHVTAEGYSGGGDRGYVDVDQPLRLNEPEQIPADGSSGDPEGDVKIEGREAGLRPHQDIEIRVESGSGDGGDVEPMDPSSPNPPIPPSGKPDGVQTQFSLHLPLITPLDQVDGTGGVDSAREPHLNRSTGPRAAIEGEWKSNVVAATKLLLRGVRDSADAFSPLKSVTGGLCFIVDNIEVRPTLSHVGYIANAPQRSQANNEAIESLAPRIKALAESLCTPVSAGDVREESRRNVLERSVCSL
jgi:hypothetical protein